MPRTPGRLSAELRRAMTARGLSQTALAQAAGYGASNLSKVLAGERLPAPDVVARLAEVLEWPSLADRAIEDRTARCQQCGVSFVRPATRGPKLYCSRQCRRTAAARQQRDSHRRRTLTETRFVRERLDLHQAAVGAFCRGCEPEALCRDAACALRPVSPLPLAGRRERIA